MQKRLYATAVNVMVEYTVKKDYNIAIILLSDRYGEKFKSYDLKTTNAGEKESVSLADRGFRPLRTFVNRQKYQ